MTYLVAGLLLFLGIHSVAIFAPAWRNAMAERLAQGLMKAGIRLGWDRQINQVFPIVSHRLNDHLLASGAKFYDWSEACLPPHITCGADELILRLVTSFATTADEVDAFIACVQAGLDSGAAR